MLRSSLMLLTLAVALSGCAAGGSATQPLPDPTRPMPVQNQSSAPAGQDPEPAMPVEQARVVPEAPQLSNQIDQLMGRLTLVQEQVIEQRNQTRQQLELTQAVLQRLQLLSQAQFTQSDQPASAVGQDPELAMQIDAAINQLLQIANEMQLNTQATASAGDWNLASAVTSKGWTLVRYQKSSGKAWLAENGGWTELTDLQIPGRGLYRIDLERRDSDSKGFVAVRIDQLTGATWWLNDHTWQAY